MQRILLPLVGVGALAVVGFFALNGGSGGGLSLTSSPKVHSGEAIVKMTEDGFIPDTLYITQGTTVKFVNEDQYGHWPASDLHPSHTIYSEFDPRRVIKPGETYEFTFERVGEWGMHDHIAPYIVGKIVVVEEK